jgi:hypothetical protein
VQVHELGGIERIASLRQRRPGGELRGDGGEQVAAVEGRRDGLEAVRGTADVDRLDGAAEALGGERQQAVVRPDEQALPLGGAQRDGAPGGQ